LRQYALDCLPEKVGMIIRRDNHGDQIWARRYSAISPRVLAISHGYFLERLRVLRGIIDRTAGLLVTLGWSPSRRSSAAWCNAFARINPFILKAWNVHQ
jgi:hypothetical protein